MMKWALAAVLLTAHGAAAADYCGLSAPEINGLPAILDDGWDATYRGGVALDNGKPQDLGEDPDLEEITLTGQDGSLALAADDFFPAVPFVLATGAADFALPGETPLPTSRLLAPQVKEFGISCDPGKLPLFEGKLAMDGSGDTVFRVIVISQDQLVLVVQGVNGGQSARAVFDLKRAGHT